MAPGSWTEEGGLARGFRVQTGQNLIDQPWRPHLKHVRLARGGGMAMESSGKALFLVEGKDGVGGWRGAEAARASWNMDSLRWR